MKVVRIEAGRPAPLGATPVAGGLDIAVWAPDATAVEVGLFDRLEGKYVPHKMTIVPHYAGDGTVEGWVGSALPLVSA